PARATARRAAALSRKTVYPSASRSSLPFITHEGIAMSSYTNTLLYINGQWCAAASGRTLPVVNPANHQQIGTVAYAEKADLDRALEAADKGFKAWRKVSAFDRCKIMRKAADIFRERADTVA